MDEHDPLLSEAYRQAARAEPPAALDARILAAANQAVASQAAAKLRPHRIGWLRWVLPASTTAVLVLAVTLVLRMQAEAPGPFPADYVPPAAKTTAAAAPAVETSSPAAANSPRAGVEPARASVAAAPAKVNVAADVTAPRSDQPAAPLPFPATAASAARMERAQADTPAAAPPSLAAGEAAGITPAPAATPAAVGNSQMRKAKQPLSTQAETEPDIERIRRLLREGRIDEARQAVAEFVRRYPAHALPEDLHGLR